MSRLLTIAAFFFPFARPLTAAQKALGAKLDTDTGALIDSAHWDKAPAAALEQANRIMDGELERRKNAEAKATTYLAVLAALVPVTLSIEAAEWDHKTGPAPEWLRLTILIIAVIYTAAAGWFAFRALQVSGVHVVGVYDLAKAWQTANGAQKLAESTARHIQASHGAINAKVTSIKVTHAHLIRAFFFFILLLLIDPVAFQLKAMGMIGHPASQCPSDPRAGAKQGTILVRSVQCAGAHPLPGARPTEVEIPGRRKPTPATDPAS